MEIEIQYSKTPFFASAVLQNGESNNIHQRHTQPVIITSEST
jgi:hypothetical protein